MRNITFIILTLSIIACSRGGSESPSPSPKYSIKVDDSWLLQRQTNNSIDTTKWIIKPETLIYNIKFFPVFDTTASSGIFYINASDSIIISIPITYQSQVYHLISRLIRANVKQGDSWSDTTIISQNPQIKVFVNTKVDSVNIQENVPAGSFFVTKVSQNYMYFHEGLTPPEGTQFLSIIWRINNDVIFVRARSISTTSTDTTEIRLIRHIKAQ